MMLVQEQTFIWRRECKLYSGRCAIIC